MNLKVATIFAVIGSIMHGVSDLIILLMANGGIEPTTTVTNFSMIASLIFSITAVNFFLSLFMNQTKKR